MRLGGHWGVGRCVHTHIAEDLTGVLLLLQWTQ